MLTGGLSHYDDRCSWTNRSNLTPQRVTSGHCDFNFHTAGVPQIPCQKRGSLSMVISYKLELLPTPVWSCKLQHMTHLKHFVPKVLKHVSGFEPSLQLRLYSQAAWWVVCLLGTESIARLTCSIARPFSKAITLGVEGFPRRWEFCPIPEGPDWQLHRNFNGSLATEHFSLLSPKGHWV